MHYRVLWRQCSLSSSESSRTSSAGRHWKGANIGHAQQGSYTLVWQFLVWWFCVFLSFQKVPRLSRVLSRNSDQRQPHPPQLIIIVLSLLACSSCLASHNYYYYKERDRGAACIHIYNNTLCGNVLFWRRGWTTGSNRKRRERAAKSRPGSEQEDGNLRTYAIISDGNGIRYCRICGVCKSPTPGIGLRGL